MKNRMPIYNGNKVIEQFLEFCQEKGFNKYFIVSDTNTYQVLGKQIQEALEKLGKDVILSVLESEGLHSDSVALSRVFASYDGEMRLFVGVGSGTITDITRFVSHRSQNSFVSFPTAASVDAYTSINAPVTIGAMKGSIYCQAPIAIFTDISIIGNAPRILTAAGFADLLSKFISSADWKISHLVWGSEFSQLIYDRVLIAAQIAEKAAEGLIRKDPESIADFINGQFESGLCMVDFGNSTPASGGEHHIAHIWEMMFYWDGQEGLYHGNAVGVAAIYEAELYARLRILQKDNLMVLLSRAKVPNRIEQEKILRPALPEIADAIINSNPIYWQMDDPEILNVVKQRILNNWDEIQAIALNVPPPERLRELIKSVGGPISTEELGVTKKQAYTAFEFGHYIRERFSINLIRKLFGWNV
jgi:glycerol-1-phosphate dehydrogenase [NAD(P)+]